MCPESIISTCSGETVRGPVRSNLLRRAKRKSLRMTVVIVLAFVICWTPYYVLFTISTTLQEQREIDQVTLLFFSFFGLSNSLLNPIIYGAFQLCKVHRHRFVGSLLVDSCTSCILSVVFGPDVHSDTRESRRFFASLT